MAAKDGCRYGGSGDPCHPASRKTAQKLLHITKENTL
jgi:hypothetical protein